MSLIVDDEDHELKVEKELKAIRENLQVIVMILQEAYEVDFTTNDIEEEL